MIRWNGVKMIANQSFLATVDEICEYSSEIDVVKVGIIGDMHSGKTTMAEAIGHQVHKQMKKRFNLPFAIRIFYEEDLLDFRETLKSLTPTNYVLVFDDVTFLDGKTNKSELSAVKQAITKIRHLEGGEDVKIILVYNYHYNLGFDKFLRQADFRYFTSVGSSEIENMEKIVGSKNMKKVHRFIKMRRHAIIKKYWTFQLNPKQYHVYRWRNPFIPVLFYNGTSLRDIISPTRSFIDPVCSVCAMASGARYSAVPIDKFMQEGNKKFPKIFESACKLKLFENGMAVYSKPMINAKKWLDQALQKKIITLEQIMVYNGWTITKTRLRKQLSQVVEGVEQKKLPIGSSEPNGKK